MAKQVAQRQKFKKKNVRRRKNHVLGVRCRLSHVTCKQPQLGTLELLPSFYEQQDAADDLDLDLSIMS